MVELETIGFEVVCLMVGLTTEVIIVALELEAPGFKGVSDWGVGLELVIDVSGFKEVVGPSVEGFKVVSATATDRVAGATEVMIVALELETPGFKGVSDWGVGLVLIIEVSGFKDVVGPSVMRLVEGFKVVSATVTDTVAGALVIGVNDVTMSVCWLLAEASVEPSMVIELGFEVLSVEDAMLGSTDEGVV